MNHQSQQPRMRFQLTIALPASGQLVGNFGIRKESPDSQETEISYELDPECWSEWWLPRQFDRLGTAQLWLDLQIVDKLGDQVGFQVLPKRWIIQCNFSC